MTIITTNSVQITENIYITVISHQNPNTLNSIKNLNSILDKIFMQIIFTLQDPQFFSKEVIAK